jgi:hypothetical protein
MSPADTPLRGLFGKVLSFSTHTRVVDDRKSQAHQLNSTRTTIPPSFRVHPLVTVDGNGARPTMGRMKHLTPG